ncbi:MAG: type II secretion system F family protein [Acidimicrobiia bacterium]|nr:type II secretion system F family protein [Acidimicrobiia bacterium]
MRLLAALLTATAVYLAVGFATGNAPALGTPRRSRSRVAKQQLWLIQAGSDLSPRQFVAGSVVAGLLGFAALWVIAGTWWVALIPAIAVAFVPYAYFSRHRTRRMAAVQKAWPDGLREILAHVNSGATLLVAIEALASRGPEALRDAFERFPAQARMFGVVPALEIVKEELSDPSSDKVIEVLILANQFGGNNLQLVLRDLIEAMSADELTAEQIRTAGFEQRLEGLVVALAPWLILLFLATVPPTYRDFYRTSTGRFVVLVAGVWAGFGWVLMRVLSRPPAEIRVFGAGSSSGSGRAR